METSPLSLFEAVFKVIEERLPFGRQLVTLTSVLMMLVVIVFALEYLASVLAPVAIWTFLAIKTRSVPSFAPLPRFAQVGEHIALVILALGWGLSEWFNRKGLNKIEKLVDEILAQTIKARATLPRKSGPQ